MVTVLIVVGCEKNIDVLHDSDVTALMTAPVTVTVAHFCWLVLGLNDIVTVSGGCIVLYDCVG